MAVIYAGEAIFLGEFYGGADDLRRVAIKTEDEGTLDVNSPGMKFSNGLFIPASQMDFLSDRAQDIRRDGFESDEKADASTAGGQIQKFGIIGNRQSGLSDPFFAQRDQGGKKFFGVIGIAGHIIIHEKEEAALMSANLVENLANGAQTVVPSEECADRAEGTAHGTPAAGLDGPGDEISFCLEKIPAGRG